jgi:hypothetical protein
MHIVRTSFRTVKLYWTTADELMRQVNELRAKEILSIGASTPDATTTAHCSQIYYEYYL